MSTQATEFKNIDDVLEIYYKNNFRLDYRDKDGIGKFMRYIMDEQLLNNGISIEDELGYKCGDPTVCAYTGMDGEFPVLSDVIIHDQYIEQYVFYILQYCYYNKDPPEAQYIRENIIPKVYGKITDNTSTVNIISPKKDSQSKLYYDEIKEDNTIIIKRVYKREFKARYSARAQLNIFISKEIIKKLLNMIEEQFDDELHAYYYTDLSAALQMNDHQIHEFMVLINNEEHKFGIINYDFHVKGTEEILLYGIFVPNDDNKVEQDKWLWKLDKFLTSEQILNRYGVKSSELPASSRKMAQFKQQLGQKLVINEELMDDTDWFSIKQIKSLKRNTKIPKVTVTLSKAMWIEECKKSFQDSDSLIPVVVNENNKHWIEWIKIIYIESQNIYVGVSCNYDKNNNKYKIGSICLDRDDIYNKHRLIGLMDNKYIEQLKGFKTSLTEIIFDDNSANNKDTKINVSKQRIIPQQNSIVRSNEPLIRSKNKNNGLIHGDDDNKCMEEKVTLSQQSVDVVVKKYDVSSFKTNQVGAKTNSYIDKEGIGSKNKLSSSVFATFIDDDEIDDEELNNQQLNRENRVNEKIYISTEMTRNIIRSRVNIKLSAKLLYKYMDSTIYSQSFKEFNTGQIRIINYEFTEIDTNNTLYCIADARQYKRYKWIMRDALYTENEIEKHFCISKHNLPASSRSKPLFAYQLKYENEVRNLIKNQYEQIIKNSNWQKIPIFNKKINKKRITLTMRKPEFRKELNEFIANNKDNIIIIPILMSDGDEFRGYHIEYVQMVKIDGASMGIAYIYNPQKRNIVVTGICVNKEFIEERHQLILLSHNDICQCLNSFISNIDCLKIGEANKENDQLKYYKDRCQKLAQFTKNSGQYMEKIASNPANIKYVSQWAQTAQQIITNDKNVNVNLDLSSLYSADERGPDNPALTQLLGYVAQLEAYVTQLKEVNHFYFQQTLNPYPKPIIPHPIHQQKKMPHNFT